MTKQLSAPFDMRMALSICSLLLENTYGQNQHFLNGLLPQTGNVYLHRKQRRISGFIMFSVLEIPHNQERIDIP